MLYTGPGLGAGIVAMVLGVIASFFLAAFAIVWYPMKRILKRVRRVDATEGHEQGPAPTPPD